MALVPHIFSTNLEVCYPKKIFNVRELTLRACKNLYLPTVPRPPNPHARAACGAAAASNGGSAKADGRSPAPFEVLDVRVRYTLSTSGGDWRQR